MILPRQTANPSGGRPGVDTREEERPDVVGRIDFRFNLGQQGRKSEGVGGRRGEPLGPPGTLPVSQIGRRYDFDLELLGAAREVPEDDHERNGPAGRDCPFRF